MRKQRKVAFKFESVRVICQYSQRYAARCTRCGEEVEMITATEAANIAGANIDKIIEDAAKGKIHLGMTPEAMLFCLNSLLGITEFSNKVKAH